MFSLGIFYAITKEKKRTLKQKFCSKQQYNVILSDLSEETHPRRPIVIDARPTHHSGCHGV